MRLSAYTGGDLDLSTAEGAYYGGMETLRARRESAVKSARVREAQDREARKGRRSERVAAVVRVYPHLRQSGRAESEEAAHSAGGNQPGRGGCDPGRGHVGAGARGIGRVDRRGMDGAGHQAGCGEAVVADVDCRHADPGVAGGRLDCRYRWVLHSGRRSLTWTRMSGWSSCSRTRRAVSMSCVPRRICCPASRPAQSAAGVASPAHGQRRADSYACVLVKAGGGTAIKAVPWRNT